MVSTGEYRLWRQIRGVGAFAHVWTQVDPSDGTGSVTVAAGTDPEWSAAAADGCRSAVRILRAQGVDAGGRAVRVTRVVGTVVDTTPDAVAAAAGMATAAAFGAADRVELVHDGSWRLRAPR